MTLSHKAATSDGAGGTAKGIHIITRDVFANAAALAAATMAATDVGGVFKQTDTPQWWLCTAAGTPGTFKEIGMSEALLRTTTAQLTANPNFNNKKLVGVLAGGATGEVATFEQLADNVVTNGSNVPGTAVRGALNTLMGVLLATVCGFGLDGALSISSGTTTLTQDSNYTNLTISGTAKLVGAGFRIFSNGVADLSACPASGITDLTTHSGGNATGTNNDTGGAVGTAMLGGTTTLGGSGTSGGTAGANGANGAGAQAAAGSAGRMGGSSGASGAGGAGSGGAAGASRSGVSANPGSPIRQFVQFPWITFNGTFTSLSGGSGGPGGGSGGGNSTTAGGGGGGGAAGGGVVYLACNQRVRGGSTAASAISCLGGNGGNGGAGNASGCAGGGGASAGGGGWIYLVAISVTGSTATNMLDASGGTGGTGGNGNGAGGGGNGGTGGNGGRITLAIMGTGTYSDTITGTGGAGGTASGTTGGTAGTAGANKVSV